MLKSTVAGQRTLQHQTTPCMRFSSTYKSPNSTTQVVRKRKIRTGGTLVETGLKPIKIMDAITLPTGEKLIPVPLLSSNAVLELANIAFIYSGLELTFDIRSKNGAKPRSGKSLISDQLRNSSSSASKFFCFSEGSLTACNAS